MKDFPDFMKSSKNLIDPGSQYTEDIVGYVFDGADGSQMAFWTCYKDRDSAGHAHDYDEYMIVASGSCILFMNGNKINMNPGDEVYIPKNTVHSLSSKAGTRTIHAFEKKRAERSF